MPTVDEELLAHQEELERQREEERRRRRQAIQAEARRQVRKQVTKQVKKRVVAVIAETLSAIFAAIAPYVLPVLAIIVGIITVLILVVITLTALCNAEGWTGRLATAGSSVSGFLGGPDFCKSLSGFEGIATVIDQGQLPFCTRPPLLAEQNNVPYPSQNDPDLVRLIQCISGLVVTQCASGGNTSVGTIFTCDNDHQICNYTRGVETCDECSHSENSCHYGGATGSTGSLAVDFGNEDNGAVILQRALACSASLGIPLKRNTCENSVAQAVACSDPNATHVHISLGKCDRDSGPINTQ